MTSRDSRLYLGHIRDAIADIDSYTAEGRAAFFASKMMRAAVVRNIEIIGEATKRLPQDLTDREPAALVRLVGALPRGLYCSSSETVPNVDVGCVDELGESCGIDLTTRP
jgi:hypothetical protein